MTNQAGFLGELLVTVTLECDDGTVEMQVTDDDGKYLFTDVPAHTDCSVTVDPTNPPSGKVPGECLFEFNVSLDPGESFLDAGLYF